jgi:tetratricopeptide (TPR) repeat protein
MSDFCDLTEGKIMLRWWKCWATVGLLVALAGCASSNDIDRINAIDARIQRDEPGTIEQAEQYLVEYPQSAVGWRTLGWARVKRDPEGARAAFDHALALDAEDANTYVGLGVYYRSVGNIDKAAEMHTTAIRLDPNDPDGYSSMGVILHLRGEYAAAVAYGEKAWMLDSSNAAIAANLAYAYHFNGNIAQRDALAAKAKELGYPHMDSMYAVFAGTLTLQP